MEPQTYNISAHGFLQSHHLRELNVGQLLIRRETGKVPAPKSTPTVCALIRPSPPNVAAKRRFGGKN
jgi:hypothetical protein